MELSNKNQIHSLNNTNINNHENDLFKNLNTKEINNLCDIMFIVHEIKSIKLICKCIQNIKEYMNNIMIMSDDEIYSSLLNIVSQHIKFAYETFIFDSKFDSKFDNKVVIDDVINDVIMISNNEIKYEMKLKIHNKIICSSLWFNCSKQILNDINITNKDKLSKNINLFEHINIIIDKVSNIISNSK